MWINLEYDDQNTLLKATGKLCSFSDVPIGEIERIREIGEENAKNWVEMYRR